MELGRKTCLTCACPQRRHHTPLISDTLIFKSVEERAREAFEAGFPAVNVDRSEKDLTAEKARKILDKYGLQVASGFFHGAFYSPEQERTLYEEAVRQASFREHWVKTACLSVPLVSPMERYSLVGRIGREGPVSLSDQQFEQMAQF